MILPPPFGFLKKKGSAPQRRFPVDAAEWTTYFPSITAPNHIWTFQQAAYPLTDGVGAFPFIEGDAPNTFQAGTDINGRYYFSQLSGVLNTGSSRVVDSPATNLAFDDNGLSLSMYVRVRLNVAAANRIIVGKKATLATSNGWRLSVNSAGGAIGMVYDSPGAGTSTLSTVNNYVDGAFHDVIFGFDRGGPNQSYVLTSAESVSLSLGAHTLFNNTNRFGIGDINVASASARGEYSYMAFWSNTVLTSANLTTIMTPV